MVEVAAGIWRMTGRPAPLVNVYLAGEVLIDAARRQDADRILRRLRGRALSELALTHAHPDHQGSASAICRQRDIPLACHADDVDAAEGRRSMAGVGRVAKLVNARWGGPAHAVEHILREGDQIGGLRVLHAPGHAPGEVIYFRESDGVAICGDVIRNISYATLRPKLLQPPDAFNVDSAQNRASIRRLAGLRPSLILPGHGPAVRDMDAFQRFVDALPH